MKTLRVELADLEGIPHGSAPAGTRAEITAAYTGVVALTDGTLIPNAIKAKTVASSGVVNFSVYPSDSPDVREEYRGFGVTVTAKVQSLNGTTVTARRTVVVPDSSPSTVHLGNLPPADPLPPQWTTVEEVIGDFDARLDSLEDHPVDHAARHAADGPDRITPKSIGALASVPGDSSAWSQSTGGGTYHGHADDMPVGTYYVTGSRAENGWPPEFAGEHSVVTVAAHYNYLRKIQTAVTLYDARMFVRVMHPTSGTWNGWRRIDSGAVTLESIGAAPALDTGWRIIPTDTATHPLAGGTVRIRRVGSVVTLKVVGLQLAASTESPVQFIPSSGSAAFNASGFVPSTGRLPFFASRQNSITDRHSMVAWTSGNNLALVWYHRESIDVTSTTRGLTLPASTVLTGEISWLTDQPWPTTLPGTPA